MVNAQDLHGMTPLHLLALRAANLQNTNYYQVFERILEGLVNFGARFDIEAKDGARPLDVAKRSNDEELVAMFYR